MGGENGEMRVSEQRTWQYKYICEHYKMPTVPNDMVKIQKYVIQLCVVAHSWIPVLQGEGRKIMFVSSLTHIIMHYLKKPRARDTIYW